MADIWLPGYERWELPGVPGTPYDELDDPKAVAHTTEGSSIDGAVNAYRAYPPQLIVDPVRRRKVQHIPLNRAGYALWNADADDSRCYQVEIVGFASQTHLWSDDTLRWLGENLALPLHEYVGVPYRVVWKGFRRDGEMPYALASASSPLRLTQGELDSFSGWLGHQHIPGDSHWDPGGLNVPKILAYAQAKEQPDMDATERAWLKESTLRLRAIHTNGFNDVGEQPRSMQGDLGWFQRQMNIALAPLTARVDKGFSDLSDDEAKLLAAIRAQPTGGQVDVTALAAQLREGLGDEVAASLGRRLTDDNDPTT